MTMLVDTFPLIFVLLAAAPADSPAGAVTSRAEATVTEAPNRLAVENESVRLVFDPTPIAGGSPA